VRGPRDAVTGVWDQNEGRVHASRGWNDREDGVGRRGAWGARWEEALADTAPIECAPHATSLIRPRSIHSHHYSLSLSLYHHTTIQYIHSKEVQQKARKGNEATGLGEETNRSTSASLFIPCIKSRVLPLCRLHLHPSPAVLPLCSASLSFPSIKQRKKILPIGTASMIIIFR
jgi:hypothetical protein